VVKDAPARVVYKFDECGFQPGEGKIRKVIGSKGSCPDLAESEAGGNITAIECIDADGWPAASCSAGSMTEKPCHQIL
jgi:hypothetical protein